MTRKYFLLFTALFFSCNEKNNQADNEYKVQAQVWTQNAAEYRALCYQAFNTAKINLDAFFFFDKKHDKPLAIITDVDETVLDNSPYDGKLILNNTTYNRESWVEWGNLEIAEAIPGSLEFLKYASEKNVEIFYISNRYSEQLESTVNNLEKLGFPDAKKSNVLLRSDSRSKSERRKSISDTYEVIMLIGDNLSDFNDEFEVKLSEERTNYTDELSNDFGTKLIVLPNPNYGDWESNGIFNGKDYNDFQKDSIRKSKIKSY
ncbi:MAG: 5'-nucleotidase, lipoprotein e(P4) family [Cytophagales bacterium]